MNADIIRVPIKFRKSIVYKNRCSCNKVKLLTIDDIPHFILGDYISLEDLKAYLENCYFCTTVLLSAQYIDKIFMCLDNNIPVYIICNNTVDISVLKAMKKVSHSVLCFHMDFFEDFIENSIEDNLLRVENMQKQAFYAKSLKISSVIYMKYDETSKKNKFDIYEISERFKNCSDHIMISFVNNCKNDSFISNICEFLSYKKLSLEILEEEYHIKNNVINHKSSGFSDTSTGLKPYWYIRTDNGFIETPEIPLVSCPFCGNLLY